MKTKRSSADLLEEAKAITPRGKDGSFDEEQLETNLATLIQIDPDVEKRRKAKAIIDSQCAVGQTPFGGQVYLPGIATYPD